MSIIAELQSAIDQIQNNLPELLNLIALAWAVQAANMFLGYRLNIFGIIPRHVIGLPGIVLSPFLHGSINHIFMNSMFFFFMGALVSLHGMTAFTIVSISIVLISGTLVWLFARLASHVGASGLIMGYWSYLMANAYTNPQFIDVLAAALGLYYFGVDLAASVAPGKGGVSVEGHLAGLIAGVVTVLFYPQVCALMAELVAAVWGTYLAC